MQIADSGLPCKMDSDNLHKLSHVALIVTNNELIIVDLFTRAKLLSFGSDTRNSPATIVISNYRGKGCQGILNPPMFANVQNDRAMLNVWSWMRVRGCLLVAVESCRSNNLILNIDEAYK